MSDEITFGEPLIDRETGTCSYLWVSPEGDPIFRVTMEDTHEKDNSIYSDITAWWLYEQPLDVRPVSPTSTLKLNSAHTSGWRSVARELSKRIAGVDIEGAMTIAVHEELTHLKTGASSVRLGSMKVDLSARPFIVDPFIAATGVTVMYGEGGISKSMLALAFAISVSTGIPIFGKEPYLTGPVVYFDYEDDPSVHAVRSQALCASLGLTPDTLSVHHYPLTAKIATSLREIRHQIRTHGAVLAVVDSIGMGRGGSAVAAEDTIRLFRHLRHFGVPVLAIDHISKEQKGKDDPDPYGSIYTKNSARLGWALKKVVAPKNDPNITMVYAQNTKHNHVAKQRSRFIEVAYRNNDYGIPEHIDITVSDDFGLLRESVPVRDRLILRLSDGEWRTYEWLAETLGVAESSVRSAVARDAQADAPMFERKGSRPEEIRLVLQDHATEDATEEDEE